MDHKKIAELVKKAQNGDNNAFGEIYELTFSYLIKRARYSLKNESDVEDVVQNAYIDAFQSINKLKDPQAFVGWISMILSNKAKKYYKNSGDEILTDEEIDMPDDENSEPTELIESDETKNAVLEMIENLPELQRITMIHYYYDEMKISEIAELMECSENTVKSRMNYAKKTMLAEIEAKRKKGIAFPVVIPFPFIFKFIFEELEKSPISSEISSKIAANVAKELGLKTLGVATKKSGLAAFFASKKAVGAVAAVVAAGGIGTALIYNNENTVEPVSVDVPSVTEEAAITNFTETTSETEKTRIYEIPVTVGDYAKIYYDYLQNTIIPEGNFIDADISYPLGDWSLVPFLLTREYSTEDPDFDTIPYTYQYDKEKDEMIRGKFHIVGDYTSRTYFTADFDGEPYAATLVRFEVPALESFQYQLMTGYEGNYFTPLYAPTMEEDSALLLEQGYLDPITYGYIADFSPSDTRPLFISKSNMQELLDRYATDFGFTLGISDDFNFDFVNTNGERIKKYFDDDTVIE